MTMPAKILAHHIKGVTGMDAIWSAILSEKRFARRIGRKLMRGPWRGFDPFACRLLFTWSGQTHQIASRQGDIEQPDADTMRAMEQIPAM